MHTQLVSRGTCQKLIWIRLMPKHSHNLSDRFNAMVKEQIWPNKGAGGGCMAPWDMEAIVKRAVESQKGITEFAWHWQNMDWVKVYEDHFHKDFKGYGDQRFWIYEFDKDLSTHHYVRVTYRADLLQPDANSTTPEFLPCHPNEKARMHLPPCTHDTPHPCHPIPAPPCSQGDLVTKREGIYVMKTLPNVMQECPIEPWKASEPDAEQNIGKRDAWHRKKVMRDIRQHTALSFPSKQQEQWAAIDMFHDLYPKSDSLPMSLPISLKPPGASQAWEMKFGTPCDWRAGWEQLTLRFDRYFCFTSTRTCAQHTHHALALHL